MKRDPPKKIRLREGSISALNSPGVNLPPSPPRGGGSGLWEFVREVGFGNAFGFVAPHGD